ncbi:hypothetical protein SUGI_0292020 [Cryptomeria japonica]|uniref:immune-associated nucleotide-binding protein 1 n=1 Tax=Cryptomeria japonica TaxID=3369 RepID=UPI002408EC3F|nr:immune-associated nucleotide-binding protein 1 [Cryptomeria japonica]GLJ16916.1 hypothetical protein SUGI_0292020 [Cryptomeria japonica]
MGGGKMEENDVNGSGRVTNLVLMGRSGNGKSSTGNSILGRTVFKSECSESSVTKECELQTTFRNGRIINVVDTPGLFDTDASPDFLGKEIVKCIELVKDGIHGIVLVLAAETRFTTEEASVLDNLQMLFGPEIVDYMLVIFTGGDKWEKKGLTVEKKLKEFPDKLQKLISQCKGRMVVFNNESSSEKDMERKISELLDHIDNIIKDNQGQPYSNELFRQAQAKSEILVSKQDLIKHKEELVIQLREMMEENKRVLVSRMEEISVSAEKIRNLEEELKQSQEDLKNSQPNNKWCFII